MAYFYYWLQTFASDLEFCLFKKLFANNFTELTVVS